MLSFLYESLQLVIKLKAFNKNFYNSHTSDGSTTTRSTYTSGEATYFGMDQLGVIRYLRNFPTVSRLYNKKTRRTSGTTTHSSSMHSLATFKSSSENSILSKESIKEETKIGLPRRSHSQEVLTSKEVWHSGQVYRFTDATTIKPFWY